MWNRIELKEKGKAAFRNNYGYCVLVSLIVGILFGLGTNVKLGKNTRFALVFASTVLAVNIIFLLIKVFVAFPLEVSACRFYLENTDGKPTVDRLLFVFKNGSYSNVVLTQFLRYLFISLWSLLLVVPGIIKAYEYRMVPYLLADDPTLSRESAFRISKEMMMGQKMDAFVLDLSFIGWYLLAAITFGITAIFYSGPYQWATNTELFLTLREEYFRTH